jgi:peptide/nickel transport system substrate-binding protein
MLGVPDARAASSPPVDRIPESTLTVALLQRVDSLNPFLGISAPAVQIFGLAYDRLTDYRTTDNRPAPGLARLWRTSADGSTWTFTIRSGVRWSDGQPLTAADVAFTYNTVMSHPASVNSAAVKTFTSVTAPDPTTLVIKTKVPTPTMLALDIPIVPAHVWQQRDPLAEPPDGGAGLVGSGPFRVVEASPGRQYRLIRNGEHWRGAPRAREVVFRYFTNSDAAAQALRKGEVDVVSGLTPAQFDAVGTDHHVTISEAHGSRFTHLGFNPGATRADHTATGDGHPALRDPTVRAAIEHAIDRRTLVARVLGGHGEPGGGYFPPAYQPWSWQPGPAVRREFDPAAANRLLDEAGYRRGADGTRTMPAGGPKLTFRLFAPTERAHYQQSATYITEWLHAVGIEVQTAPMADTQIGDRVRAGRYDMFLSGWLLDPDPDFLLSVQTCNTRPDAGGNGTTDAFTCDATFDALYERQSHEIDVTTRVQLVQQMQQRLYETAAQVILYYPAVLEAYRNDRFGGLTRRPATIGSIAGPWSYVNAVPVATRQSRSGSGARVVSLAVLTAVALAGAIWLFVRRRRATRDHRE